MISIIAVTISGISMYVQHFYKPNRLMFYVDVFDIHADKNKISASVTFINQGKQPNAIVSIDLMIKTGDTSVGSYNEKNPFIIQPDEIMYKNIITRYKRSELLKNISGSEIENVSFPLYLNVRTLTLDGSIIEKKAFIGAIAPNKDLGGYSVSSAIQSFDLLNGSIISLDEVEK